MSKTRYNLDLVFANVFFGANFSFYVSLTRNFLDFQQIFMLQVLSAAVFFIPFALFSKQSFRITWRDAGNILIVSLLLISVPTFVTGFLCQYFLGVKWHLLPVTAGANPGFLDLLMPAMVLGSVSMAYIIRLSRTEISSNIALDYVRTARAKGMDNKSVMLRHVLRNSMIPVVTYLGQDLGALMGGAMISETIFNVHGIGYLTYQSILKGEGNLVVSIVTLLMLIFVVCNLLVDMLYAALDPRIRYA